MDPGVAFVIGAAIGAVAGIGGAIGGALILAWSTRTAARESDERQEARATRDRLRGFRVEQIKETSAYLARQFQVLSLLANGQSAEAAALEQRPIPGATSGIVNMSVLEDDDALRMFFELKGNLVARGSATADERARLVNLQVIMLGQLKLQEQQALADKPPIQAPQKASSTSPWSATADDPGPSPGASVDQRRRRDV